MSYQHRFISNVQIKEIFVSVMFLKHLQHLPCAEFPTNALEMNAVANIFDMNSDGYIDYYEFVSALHPSRDPYRKTLDADQINEEVENS